MPRYTGALHADVRSPKLKLLLAFVLSMLDRISGCTEVYGGLHEIVCGSSIDDHSKTPVLFADKETTSFAFALRSNAKKTELNKLTHELTLLLPVSSQNFIKIRLVDCIGFVGILFFFVISHALIVTLRKLTI